MTVDKVDELVRIAAQQPVSLDTPASDDGFELSDLIEDENAPDPLAGLHEELQRRNLKRVLALLSDKQREIIAARFGLDGHSERTLEELGATHGVSRERIRKIQVWALTKMRAACECRRPLLSL